jgi:acetate---CoA ligase (ADP-forming)
MTDDARERLRTALNPRSIALIGASDNPNKIGGRPLAYLARFGYRGSIYPINPNRAETQGYKTYPALAALPEAPEMAIIAVAGDLALQAVEECALLGVQVAIVMASGFGETDAAGVLKERRMVQLARAQGMRVIGPNTQGLANFATGTVVSFSTMFTEAPPADGPVGIVSQSGAMSVVPYGLLRQRGIGIRYAHSTGNDCDVTTCELASIVAEDPDLKLLLLYLEGISDPWNLAETARVAHERNLPVIALKSGRTAAGAAAARSHTGALANEDRVVDAFLEKNGIWRARTTADLVDGAELYLKGWKPKGRRLVTISNSGAIGVMSADAATQAAMPLAKLSAQTLAGLSTVLPSFATTTNPIDLTAALLSNGRLLSDVLPILAGDAAADAFLLGIAVAGAGYDLAAFAQDSAAFTTLTGKPLVVAAPQASVAEKFQAEGLVTFRTESEAVHALAQYLSHLELMQRVRQRDVGDTSVKPHKAEVDSSRQPREPDAGETKVLPLRALNEAESLALLQRQGLNVVSHRLCRSAGEAEAALLEIPMPVVVKGCSSDVEHKSEHGLVRVGLQSSDEVLTVYPEMENKLRAMGARFDGVIIAAMAKGRREIMIGAHHDPVFGPVVVVGDGGKYVESMQDIQTLLPPFSHLDAAAALARLRIAPLLAGVRGEPPMDVDALCDAVVAVGEMISEDPAQYASMDLNPVILGSRGEGYWVVDALIYAI